MTDYTKLVEALRLCQFGECGCGKCYYKELKGDWCTEDNHPEFFDCDDKLKLDAAAAIEELLESVGMLGEQRSYWIDKAAEYYNQLPKRGEWMDVTDSYFWYGRCSVCGAELNVDGWYAELMNYCPSCGAKMEAQDETN